MEQVVEIIQDMINQGLAYENQGSVFFDWDAYKGQPDENNCTLPPEVINKAASQAENEPLTSCQDTKASRKHSKCDFPLWCPVEEEPKWPSPWGMGRPGMHLAFGAVSGDGVVRKFIGNKEADIYSSGLLSKHRHHHSYGHTKCCVESAAGNGWCEPLRDALHENTPVHFRLLCLSRKYNVPTKLDSEVMGQTVRTENLLRGFFDTVKREQAQLQQKRPSASPHTHRIVKWDHFACKLQVLLQESKDKVDAALKDLPP
jgi:cysteinyl-tRNA synthetase